MGHIASRTAAIIEGASVQDVPGLDQKEPENLEVREGVIERTRLLVRGPEPTVKVVPCLTDSVVERAVSTRPESREFVQAVKNLCRVGNQDLDDYEDQRLKFIRMIREFEGCAATFLCPWAFSGRW